MIKRLTCAIFGHDRTMYSPESLHVVIECQRCGEGTNYEFQVDDDFWRDHFPGHEPPMV